MNNENYLAVAKKHAGGSGNLTINFAWPYQFPHHHLAIPYIANCLRWKSFADGQGTSNLLENSRGSFTPVKMCFRAYAISLIECICLIILDNYMYHLTCRFLSLAGSVAVRLYQAQLM